MAQSKDDIRAQILGNNHKARSKVIEFFGADVEIRQPQLGEIITAQTDEDRNHGAAMMLIRYAYVPGTDEHVFTDEDTDVLLQLPFGEDFTRLMEAIKELSDVNFRKPASGSNSVPPSSGPIGSLPN